VFKPFCVTVTVDAPTEVRTAVATALAANGGGATIRSLALVAEPAGVVTTIFPDDAMGTVAVNDVALALVICANCPLTKTLLLAVSKFVPVIVTAVPGVAVVGVEVPVVKLVTVGGAAVMTVKLAIDVAVPDGLVTDTGPVVAPVGTETVIAVALTTLGVAGVPLKLTEVLATVPNAVPEIVTEVPTAPAAGETCRTVTAEIGFLTIAVMLPARS
jgi:hypothetical protein